MRPIVVSALFASLVLLLAACKPKAAPWGINGRPLPVSDYSNAEIKTLRTALAGVSFPADAFTVEKLLPQPVKSVAVENVDGMPHKENKGRVGGIVREYWLNRDQVLKVASAYYQESGVVRSREEWAVILSRRENEHFSREIYPGAGRIIIAK